MVRTYLSIMAMVFCFAGCEFAQLATPKEKVQEGLADDPKDLKLALEQFKEAKKAYDELVSALESDTGADTEAKAFGSFSKLADAGKKAWGWVSIILGTLFVGGLAAGSKYGSKKYPIDTVVASIFKLAAKKKGEMDLEEIKKIYEDSKEKISEVKESGKG